MIQVKIPTEELPVRLADKTIDKMMKDKGIKGDVLDKDSDVIIDFLLDITNFIFIIDKVRHIVKDYLGAYEKDSGEEVGQAEDEKNCGGEEVGQGEGNEKDGNEHEGVRSFGNPD